MNPFTASRSFLCNAMIIVLSATALICDVSSSNAENETTTPNIGSFNIGGDITGGINERTGAFNIQAPVASLPGLNSDAIDLTVSYHHENALQNNNRFGLGAAWSWNMSFVNNDGGVHIFPASGGAFEADASQPSGLARYRLTDLVFQQKTGTLAAREEVPATEYAYSLAYLGGITDYFNTAGNLISRVTPDGRSDWIWESQDSHHLTGVIDSAGSYAKLIWTETSVDIVSPPRSDGVTSTTRLTISGDHITGLTSPLHNTVAFQYNDAGLLSTLSPDTSATTEIRYQTLPDTHIAVETLRVVDTETHAELSRRVWKIVEEHTSEGWPVYSNSQVLWGSGDGQYHYQTQLSDGVTRIISEYNSLGLLISQTIIASTPAGDHLLQEHNFSYPGTENGTIADPQNLPAHYTKPLTTNVIFHGQNGRTRSISEHATYNSAGQEISTTSSDGIHTTTVYDTHIPENYVLPLGLVSEQTTTGTDGAISQTINTLNSDHTAIQATEIFTGSSFDTLTSTSRTEYTLHPDGYIAEQREIARGEMSGGPTTIVTRFHRTVDHKTITYSQINAAGTPAENTTSVITDKASGRVVNEIDAIGRAASSHYDPAGRILASTDFSGHKTLTEYGTRVTRVTDPLGITVSQYVNILGQPTILTDNIVTVNGTAVPSPGEERVIETRKYENNSSTVTVSDSRGLRTATTTDVFGRPISVTAPNGLVRTTTYNEVDNTTTVGDFAETTSHSAAKNGLTVTTTRKDNTNRITEETISRSDGIAVPAKTTIFDGLGRIKQQIASDLSTHSELSPNGTPKHTVITPQNPDFFPGGSITATREHNIFGSSTKKTLHHSNGENREGVSRIFDAAGRVASTHDQVGKETWYTYTSDGLETEIRDTTGGFTHNTYDSTTRALTLTETIAPDGTTSSTGFEYHPVTGKTVAVFDPLDRDATQIRYDYDIFGNTTTSHTPTEQSFITPMTNTGAKHTQLMRQEP